MIATQHKLSAQERKAAIVNAAIRLFSEKGFRGTTTRELALTLGVSEPVLYQHFATKRDLYAAIIDTKSQDVARLPDELGRFGDANDDRGFFTRVAEMILNFHETNPAYLRLLLYSALEHHELAELFHERQTCSFFDVISQYIERRVEEGVFRVVDPMFVAQAFVGCVGNFGLNRVLFQKPALDRAAIDNLASIFLRGILNDSK